MIDDPYRSLWQRSIERANLKARGYVKNPKAGSELEQRLASSKALKQQLLANWNPFRTGSVRTFNERTTMQTDTGPANFKYLQGQEDVSKMLVDATMEEMNVNKEAWLQPLLQDFFTGKKQAQGVSRESGEK